MNLVEGLKSYKFTLPMLYDSWSGNLKYNQIDTKNL